MKRDEIMAILHRRRRELERFGVKSIAFFGSTVRGEGRPRSDVDILVEFSKPVGLFEFVRLQSFLKRILRRPVDLTTPDALRPQMREWILREAVYAA
jgi:predicted nucleotidyltransferase